MGKIHTVDPIFKQKLDNFGEQDKFYIENHHEPIISKEDFEFDDNNHLETINGEEISFEDVKKDGFDYIKISAIGEDKVIREILNLELA